MSTSGGNQLLDQIEIVLQDNNEPLTRQEVKKLFTCLNGLCLTKGGVKVLRCQLPQSNPYLPELIDDEEGGGIDAVLNGSEVVRIPVP